MRTVPIHVAALVLGMLLAGATGPLAHAQPEEDSTYTVRDGDTLYSIAQRFEVSVATLQRWNDLADTHLEAGQVLRVQAPQQSRPDTASTYTVRPGDTLFRIAQRFGVSVQALQTWNDLVDTSIETGQTLQVRPPDAPSVAELPEPEPAAAPDTTSPAAPADPSSSPPSTERPVGEPPLYGRYTPSEGESLLGLALRIDTTANALFALNDSSTAPLSPERRVRLPQRFAPPTHEVKAGETLFDIAGTYGVSVRALRAANGLDTTAVETGRRLRLPGRNAPPVPRAGMAAPDTTGSLSVYPSTYEGRLMSSGMAYDPAAFVGAHPSLPYGSLVLLTNPATGRHTFVRVADRGPLDPADLMDVSAVVARQLDLSPDSGNESVELRVVWVHR
jgi:LysM repeat protein